MSPNDHEDPSAQETEEEAGDRACWAYLVCPECGAVESEGHRPDCTVAQRSRRD